MWFYALRPYFYQEKNKGSRYNLISPLQILKKGQNPLSLKHFFFDLKATKDEGKCTFQILQIFIRD